MTDAFDNFGRQTSPGTTERSVSPTDAEDLPARQAVGESLDEMSRKKPDSAMSFGIGRDVVENAVDDLSDDLLVLNYQRGDSASFEKLYNRHKGAIYRFFLRQLPPAQANDGFQETWTKLITNIDKFEPRGAFQAYLFKLAHNVLMDHHRQSMRASARRAEGEIEPDDIVAEGSDVTEQVSAAELRQLLHAEIALLPINQRTVWLIKQETRLNHTEIAELTGTSLEGVKSRLRYANEKLKAGMQRYVRT